MKYFLHKAVCLKNVVQLLIDNKILYRGYLKKDFCHPPMRNAFSQLPPEDAKRYYDTGNAAIESALDILSSQNWSVEVTSGDDVIESKYLSGQGKIFRFQGVIDFSPEEVFEQIHVEVENSDWNKSVKSAKVLQKIDDKTDVVHVVTNEEAGGLFASRSFVIVRTWQRRGNALIDGYTSVTHPLELQSSCVRGEQGPCAYVLSRVEGDPSKCHVQWLLCTRLKGWIPQSIVDSCMYSAMINYMQHLRNRIKFLKTP